MKTKTPFCYPFTQKRNSATINKNGYRQLGEVADLPVMGACSDEISIGKYNGYEEKIKQKEESNYWGDRWVPGNHAHRLYGDSILFFITFF